MARENPAQHFSLRQKAAGVISQPFFGLHFVIAIPRNDRPERSQAGTSKVAWTMPLNIETFSNVSGGNAFFKALTHPIAAQKADALIRTLKAKGQVAIYDPLNLADMIAQAYEIASLPVAGYYVQEVEARGRAFANHMAKLVTELPNAKANSLFITAFDAARLADQIRHLIGPDMSVHSLDSLRLPDEMLSDKARYLSPLNFATNFVFFRD